MNNKSFIQRLSQATGYTQDDSQKMVYSIVDAMNEQFQKGENVTFPSFGTFEVKKRMERIVVNPTTRQRMLVPPKLVLGFRPVASVRRVLKEGGHETFDGGKMRGLAGSPIIAYLMQKHGIKQNEAGTFVGEFITIINESLRDEKQVKIKGLGTFKVVDVKDRQSVDVNTGERIVIEGRSKISFTPDSVIKELVNKPFSQFETVVLNPGVSFDDIDEANNEEEAETILADEEHVAEEPADEEHVAEEPAVEEPAETPIAPVVSATPIEEDIIEVVDEPDMPQQESENSIIVNEEPVDEENPISIIEIEEPITDEQPVRYEVVGKIGEQEKQEQQEEEETDDMEKNKKSTPWCLHLTIGILSMLIGFGAGWFVRDQIYKTAKQTQPTEPVVEQTSVDDSLETERMMAEMLRKDSLEQVRKDSLEQVWRDSIEKARRDSLEKVQKDLERVKKELEAQKEAEEKAAREAKQKEQQAATANQNPSLASARRQVELGAYSIVGTQETITVKEGQSISRISKFYFGDGMECYLQVHNGVAEVKPGMKLKIPKLQSKKKK